MKASEVETDYGHVLVLGVSDELLSAFDFGKVGLPLELVLRACERHGAIAVPCSPQSIITPDSDAMGALTRMSQSKSSHLMVVEEDRLLGIVAAQDLLQFLSSQTKIRGAKLA